MMWFFLSDSKKNYLYTMQDHFVDKAYFKK